MKEIRFIEQNKARWSELEDALAGKSKDPDQLSDLFVKVTDDLSYARTFYGNRVVRVYLNQLTQRLLRKLFRNTVNHRAKLKDFVRVELPMAMYSCRKAMLLALIIFLVSAAIGVFSAAHDASFTESILGTDYINTTNANIDSGDPMAIYKDSDVLNMFLFIARNNLLVAFRTFLMGLLFSVGTAGILVFNGILVGVFQYYFITRGLGFESALAIWTHGSMEIPAIIISGGAGLMMGSGLVFPGTYTRLQALRLSARNSIRIMAAVTPIILIAALIESLITRFTELSDAFRLVFILLQLGFIVFYFVIYPLRIGRKNEQIRLDEEVLPASKPIEEEMESMSLGAGVFSISFRFFFYFLGDLLKRAWPWIIGLTIYFCLQSSDHPSSIRQTSEPLFFLKLNALLDLSSKPYHLILLAAMFALLTQFASVFTRGSKIMQASWLKPIYPSKKRVIHYFFGTFLIALFGLLPLVIDSGWGTLLFILTLPFTLTLIAYWNRSEKPFITSISEGKTLFFGALEPFYASYFSIALPAAMLLVLTDLSFYLLNTQFLEWLFEMNDTYYQWIQTGMKVFTSVLGLFLASCLYFFSTTLTLYSAEERVNASGLKKRLLEMKLIKEA